MKKYLPLGLLLLGIVAVVVAVFVLRGRSAKTDNSNEEEALIEVELNDRPVASLTPTADGHWLKLKIEKLQIDAASLDYILSYKLPDGRTQGVPGSIKLTGQESIDRELLLGSESSGKFRYDEGVEEGTLTLRFRNDKGQLMVKFETDFKLSTKLVEAKSVDGKFSYTFEDELEEFVVVMQTFGTPSDVEGSIASGPWGVFVSGVDEIPGQVAIDDVSLVSRYADNEWEELDNGASNDVGVFVGL